MAKVMVFNPRSRGRSGKGAEKIASRRFGASAGVYRPSFAHGHQTSDSVRERLVRYKIAKPTSGKRVLLNGGTAEDAAASNPRGKKRAKKSATKAKKPVAKKVKAKKPAAVAKKAKSAKSAAKKPVKAKKAKRRNSAPVMTVPSGAGSLVLAKNGKKKTRRSAKGKFARSAKPSVSSAEAKAVLKQGYVTGPDGKRRKLTAKQKRYFGWAAGGYQERKAKRPRKGSKRVSAASAKASKAKTAQKARSTRSKMARRKKSAKAGRLTKAASKAKRKKTPKKTKKVASKRKKTKKTSAKKRKTSRKAKARKAPSKRKKSRKSKGSTRKAARRPKKRKSSRKVRRNDELDLVVANKGKRRKSKKRKSVRRRRNDGALTEAQLQVLAKKLAPKYQRAKSAAQRKTAREEAQRAALAAVAERLGVAAPTLGPVSSMAKQLAERVSSEGFKVSEKQIKRMLTSVPKPAESLSIDQAIAKMATAIEKIAGGRTASRRSKSRKSPKRSKSKSRSSKKATRSKAKRNGKRRSKRRKTTALAKATPKKRRAKKKKASKKAKAKKSSGRKAKRRKSKGKAKGKGRKAARRKGKAKVRRNAGFDLIRKIPGSGYVEQYADNLKEVGFNYLPGGLAGLAGAYGVPSAAFSFLPASMQQYNQGWWGVLTSAIGVGVAAGVTGFVASKVQPGSARKQTIGAVLGGSLAIATKVISALTAPSNPIRRAIGTDASRLADYAGMSDLMAPDYLGDNRQMIMANAADNLIDLDYGQPGDQIGMTPDTGISDFVAPMMPGMSDFAAPAMDDLVAASAYGMGQAWPGSVDNTLELSGDVPVTDFALGDGSDEMCPSDVDDGDQSMSDMVEVQGPQVWHR